MIKRNRSAHHHELAFAKISSGVIGVADGRNDYKLHLSIGIDLSYLGRQGFLESQREPGSPYRSCFLEVRCPVAAR